MTGNRLKASASPYLRSAAHQPIDWHEWGEDAFVRAKSQDKPILLDIGAVWCHWCHVIDRESYENPAIAKIINEQFVPVKVDRDERPDVDSRYQSAISALTGQGGWPLTGFLMPDGKPFFGGTYFPPEDQGGRPGFRRILLAVADAYENKREDLLKTSEALSEAVAKAEAFTGARADFDPGLVDSQISSMTQLFDIRNGGFGKAGSVSLEVNLDISTSSLETFKPGLRPCNRGIQPGCRTRDLDQDRWEIFATHLSVPSWQAPCARWS